MDRAAPKVKKKSLVKNELCQTKSKETSYNHLREKVQMTNLPILVPKNKSAWELALRRNSTQQRNGTDPSAAPVL